MKGGRPDLVPLTPEERRAIASLRRLAARWPKSLWLFSASGSLCVMRCGDDGQPVHEPGPGGVVDRAYKVESVSGIGNDGGDW